MKRMTLNRPGSVKFGHELLNNQGQGHGKVTHRSAWEAALYDREPVKKDDTESCHLHTSERRTVQ